MTPARSQSGSPTGISARFQLVCSLAGVCFHCNACTTRGENGNTSKHSHSKALFLPWLLSASAGGGQRRQSVDLPLGFMSVRPPFPPLRFLPPHPRCSSLLPLRPPKSVFPQRDLHQEALNHRRPPLSQPPAPAAKQGMPGKPSAAFLHTPLCLASVCLFSKNCCLLKSPPPLPPRLHRTGEVALCE